MNEPSPTEDLMREHGILNRILLIYEEILYRISNNMPFSYDDVKEVVMIVKTFIEEYHEPMEEKYVFSLFTKLNLHVDLIRELIIMLI